MLRAGVRAIGKEYQQCWYAPPNVPSLSFIPQFPFNSAPLSSPISVSSYVHIHQSPIRTDRLFSISLLISPQLRVLLHTTDTNHFAYPSCSPTPPTRSSDQSHCSRGRHVSFRPALGESQLRVCTAHRRSQVRAYTAHRRSQVHAYTVHRRSQVRACTAHRRSQVRARTVHRRSQVRARTVHRGFPSPSTLFARHLLNLPLYSTTTSSLTAFFFFLLSSFFFSLSLFFLITSPSLSRDLPFPSPPHLLPSYPTHFTFLSFFPLQYSSSHTHTAIPLPHTHPIPTNNSMPFQSPPNHSTHSTSHQQATQLLKQALHEHLYAHFI